MALTWDRLDLSAVFDKAYFRDVTAYAGGFVIVGRVGEPDVVGGAEPAVGRPAAWTSPDGVTWVAAEVEGAEAPVPGWTRSSPARTASSPRASDRHDGVSGQGPRSGWASTDGRSWQLVGEMGTDLPLATVLGAKLVRRRRRAHGHVRPRVLQDDRAVAWTSLDGVTWTQLAFSGATAYLPTIAGPICNDDGTEGSMVGSLGISYAVVVRDGVFVVASSSAPVAPTYWFLTATTH